MKKSWRSRLRARHRHSRLALPHPPRRRHLPLASTERSLTENLNKTGVRLWTSPRLQCQR